MSRKHRSVGTDIAHARLMLQHLEIRSLVVVAIETNGTLHQGIAVRGHDRSKLTRALNEAQLEVATDEK